MSRPTTPETARMERQPATALATFALALAAGTVAVAGNGWFGRGDLVAFAIHTIPFAALAPPAAGLVFAATRRLPVVVAVAAGFVSGLLFGYASAAAVALLRGTGLRGALEPRGSFASNTTGWPRATALVVFTGPLDAAVSLPQPRHGSIVYVQEAAGFRRVPADAPTFARPLRLLPGPDGLRFLVVHASGAVSGLDIAP